MFSFRANRWDYMIEVWYSPKTDIFIMYDVNRMAFIIEEAEVQVLDVFFNLLTEAANLQFVGEL